MKVKYTIIEGIPLTIKELRNLMNRYIKGKWKTLEYKISKRRSK